MAFDIKDIFNSVFLNNQKNLNQSKTRQLAKHVERMRFLRSVDKKN